MHDSKRLNVLVTGGASGLGESIATSFAQAGARVVIADINEELGRAVERQLAAAGHEAKYVYVDATSTASQVNMLREALAWLPDGQALDSLVLSAGINGNPFDLSPEDPSALDGADVSQMLERSAATVQVNLVSVLQIAQLVVKYGMGLKPPTNGDAAGSGRKSITLIGSLAGYRALPRAADYSAAKWGVRGAFRSLRQQLPKIGVRVNLVAPAFVRTPLLTATIPLYEKMGVKFADVKHVVAAVNTVVSDEHCSGKAFAVSSEGVKDLNDGASGMDASEVMNGLNSRAALGATGAPLVSDD